MKLICDICLIHCFLLQVFSKQVLLNEKTEDVDEVNTASTRLTPFGIFYFCRI